MSGKVRRYEYKDRNVLEGNAVFLNLDGELYLGFEGTYIKIVDYKLKKALIEHYQLQKFWSNFIKWKEK